MFNFRARDYVQWRGYEFGILVEESLNIYSMKCFKDVKIDSNY